MDLAKSVTTKIVKMFMLNQVLRKGPMTFGVRMMGKTLYSGFCILKNFPAIQLS